MTAAPARKDSARLQLIDSFRGVAALLVLLFHSEVTVARAKYFGTDVLHGIFVFGAHGVDFFFVLSGFIVSFAHWNDIGHPERVRRYLSKRFLRVYPPLWALALPFILLTYATHADTAPPGLLDKLNVAVTSLLLLPSNLAPIPIVVWTLKHEIVFYLMFATVLLRPVLGTCLLVAWTITCVFSLATDSPFHGLAGFFFSPYNTEFMVGILCACVLKFQRLRSPMSMMWFGVAAFALAAVVADTAVTGNYADQPQLLDTNGELVALFSVASALLVLGASRLDLEGRCRPPAFMPALGAASYSIYLVHYPVVSVCCKLLKALSRHLFVAPLTAVSVTALAALQAGILFHRLVEKPLGSALAAALAIRRSRAGGALDGAA